MRPNTWPRCIRWWCWWLVVTTMNYRSSHYQTYSIKKTFLKNFAIFTGAHLCLFLIKLQTFTKKRLQHRLMRILKVLRTPILKNICERLLLEPLSAVIYFRIKLNLRGLTDLRPATLLKKRLWHRCFPVKFAKILTNLFL